MLTGIPSTLGDSFQLNTTSLIRHAATVFDESEVVYRRSDGSWGRSNYADEFKRIAQLAHGLTELGIGAGSMVGVLDWNSRRHFELYFAVPGLAATMLQLNLRLAAEDLAYVVSHSTSDWIAVDESLLPVAEALASKAEVKGWIVMTDRPAAEIETSLGNVVFYEDLIAGQPETYDWPVVAETTAAYAGYTTGTTGRPKGVYYSHRSIYLHTMGGLAALNATFEDCVMPITPMFHVLSWGFPQNAVAAGAKLVLPGKFAAEEFAAIGQAFITEKVTLANGAPAIFAPMLEMMRKMPEPPDLRGVRLVSGSSEPPLSMMRGFKEITGAEVVHGYGATETTPLATTNWRIKPGLDLSEEERWDFKRFQGLPIIGVEIKVVDPTGEELPRDGKSMGEVVMRGPWITESYFQQPDNAERFLDGWWRSGDVGVIYPNGYLKLTDRLKDVIKSGGEWISSIDMENAILDSPRVREAAVIGVPDERWQERPVAYVVPEDGAEVTRDDIVEVLGDRFAKWQLPDEVIVTDELPRTSVGKLDKKILRQNWEADA
ncbi:fatty-acyl-CoA synthase [Brevibacterium sanguinis]|uniref:Fatty-acyl-CoA synthase n=2 Tax=Brevibacterium TaxID=1696 RepID=A0A366IJ20_9MICO|nr:MULTISPECIES: long-chain-fatty-acid--CoA ligase [Brevibacterium]RBP65486.1 fatty-acyl-CoA synthase [Brevibacterium sanguinis]RBP72120.1 fatty-acyl-CoA synthase [Brevibacterium celere]